MMIERQLSRTGLLIGHAVAIIELGELRGRQMVGSEADIQWSWIDSDKKCPGRKLTAHVRLLNVTQKTSQILIACECSAASAMRCVFRSLDFDKRH